MKLVIARLFWELRIKIPLRLNLPFTLSLLIFMKSFFDLDFRFRVLDKHVLWHWSLSIYLYLFLSLYTLKTSEKGYRFLVFSGTIERDQCHEKGIEFSKHFLLLLYGGKNSIFHPLHFNNSYFMFHPNALSTRKALQRRIYFHCFFLWKCILAAFHRPPWRFE